MADGVINIFVQLFSVMGLSVSIFFGAKANYPHLRPSLYWIFTAVSPRPCSVLIFCYRLYTGIADALAKPTIYFAAALSVHVSPARQGIVIGTAQALIAIADFISPVLK
ncbi:hypothetical protein KCP70_24235 [Salmonella enterica subsp. enterica]|nr:hypothetical protein KCP70_24235 [Salmonella enterica subsp. enterica]